MYTVHCSLYSVHCALCTVHCTVYTVQCTQLYVFCMSVQSDVINLHYKYCFKGQFLLCGYLKTRQGSPIGSRPSSSFDQMITEGLVWGDERSGCSYVSAIRNARKVRANLAKEKGSIQSPLQVTFITLTFHLTQV